MPTEGTTERSHETLLGWNLGCKFVCFAFENNCSLSHLHIQMCALVEQN